jgi:hypothetical protein
MCNPLYLKWTRKGRVPPYQGGASIPYRKWTPDIKPELCVSGWHACRWEDALEHISDQLWSCELRGDIVAGDDKVAATSMRIQRRVRLDDRALRLFAADCAEQALRIFYKVRPGDDRPAKAIEAARRFADGQISQIEMAAAGDAAGDAARDATRDAAWAAPRDAAWAAAWAAAGAAARDAAGAAAGDAAGAAAGDAAWAAAGAAAGDAAWDAAGAWQTERLLVHYAELDPADFAHKTTV